MRSLRISPTLSLDIYLPGELGPSGTVVLYREDTDDATEIKGQDVEALIAALQEAHTVLRAAAPVVRSRR